MFASPTAVSNEQMGVGTAVEISPSAVSLPPTYSVDLTYLVQRALQADSIASEGANRGR